MPDATSVTRSGDFLDFGKPFIGNFCKGVKIYHFYSEIIYRQLLQTFGDFYLVTLDATHQKVTKMHNKKI